MSEGALQAVLVVAIPAIISGLVAWMNNKRSATVDAFELITRRLEVTESRVDDVPLLRAELAALRSYILVLRRHIDQQLPPPPPELLWPRLDDNDNDDRIDYPPKSTR